MPTTKARTQQHSKISAAERAERKEAVALLRKLRSLVRRDADVGLATAFLAMPATSGHAYSRALDALDTTRFYALTTSCSAMGREVEKAITRVQKGHRP